MGLNEQIISASDVIEYLELKKKELINAEVLPKPKYVSLQEDETEEKYKSFRISNSEKDSKNSEESEESESIKEMLNKIVKIKPQKVESGGEAPLTVDEAIDIYLTTKMNNNSSPNENELSKEESSGEPKVLYQRYYGPVNTKPSL